MAFITTLLSISPVIGVLFLQMAQSEKGQIDMSISSFSAQKMLRPGNTNYYSVNPFEQTLQARKPEDKLHADLFGLKLLRTKSYRE